MPVCAVNEKGTVLAVWNSCCILVDALRNTEITGRREPWPLGATSTLSLCSDSRQSPLLARDWIPGNNCALFEKLIRLQVPDRGVCKSESRVANPS